MWAYSFQHDAESVRSGLAVIAGIVVSLGVIIAPFWRPIRRVIASKRLDADHRRNQTLAATIVTVMRPEIDAIRTAARQQHDEQNQAMADGFTALGEQIDEVRGQVTELGGRVETGLDAGTAHLARHDIEIAVLQARDPNARQRATDLQED